MWPPAAGHCPSQRMGPKADAIPKSKKRRQSHAKVKSGCLTWIRRVKCDETKPNCLKCTSTSRKCDGYRGKEPLKFINSALPAQVEYMKHVFGESALDNPVKYPANPMLSMLTGSPQNPLLDFSGTPMEHRSLDFFRNGAAPALSGYFDAEFWSETLPRVAYSEPAIQHALIALGSLYEYCVNVEDYPNVLQQRFALVHYNKAIRALKTCRVGDPRSREITLLTCILFVCLELLGGNPENALDHLDNGLNILRQSQGDKDGASPFNSLNRPSQRQALEIPQSTQEVLDATFSRLSLQASLCARRLPRIYPMKGRITIEDAESARLPFTSIQEARSSLNEIFIQSFQPLELPSNFEMPAYLFGPLRQSQRETLISELHHWNSRLALYVTDSLPNLHQEEIQGSRVLRVLSIIAIIWNDTAESNMETAFDAHLQDYKTVIQLASSVIPEDTSTDIYPSSSPSPSTLLPSPTATLSSAPLSPPTPPNSILDRKTTTQNTRSPRLGPAFTFEMSLLPVLYFTALKCRSPSLRRLAVSLLRRAMPQREGLWDARVLAAIAQHVIDFEESGSQGEDGCLETRWPPEDSRVHSVILTPVFGVEERRQGLSLIWRPDGVEGGWKQFDVIVQY